MTDLNRMKHLAGLTMESGRGLLKEYGDMDADESVQEAGGYYTQPIYDMIEKHGYEKVMHKLLTSLDADVIQDFISRADLDEATKLGKNVYDPGQGHQGPGGYVDRDTRAMQGDNQTPIDLDGIIKRGKENQIIGKYQPPGSPRDPELDGILRRRAKELEPDPRIGELPMPDDGRLEIPGYDRDKMRDLPLTPGPQKPDYNRDKIRDLIQDLPLTPGPQKGDEFKKRIDRIRKVAR